MKALVIYAHPNPQSFNAAILETVKEALEQKGAEVKVKDLYAMNWNPVLGAEDFRQIMAKKPPEDIAREQADVVWADLLVTVSPIWWMSVPAILKGYVERVLSTGFAYEYTDQGPRGLLAGKKAAVITTSGADENAANQSGMMKIFKASVVSGIFNFCGITDVQDMNCFGVTMVSDEERHKMLKQVKEFIQQV